MTCGHLYHDACILDWCQHKKVSMQHIRCAVCRLSAETPPPTGFGDSPMLIDDTYLDTPGTGSSNADAVAAAAGSGAVPSVGTIANPVADAEMLDAGTGIDGEDASEPRAAEDGPDGEDASEPRAAEDGPAWRSKGKTQAKARARAAREATPAVEEEPHVDAPAGKAKAKARARAAREATSAVEGEPHVDAPAGKAKAKARSRAAREATPAVEEEQHVDAPAVKAKAKAKARSRAVPEATPVAAPAGQAKAKARTRAAPDVSPVVQDDPIAAAPAGKEKAKPRARAAPEAPPASAPVAKAKADAASVAAAAGPPKAGKATGKAAPKAADNGKATSNAAPKAVAVHAVETAVVPAAAAISSADSNSANAMHLFSQAGFSTEVACDSCGNFVNFMACRIVAKSSGRWRCNKCGVTQTQLRRHYGHWPSGGFSLLSPEVQREFYSAARDAGQDATVSAAETLVQREVMEESFAEGGQYLPLSVWSHKGFDIGPIEKNSRPDDVEWHEQCECFVYRVRIKSKVQKRSRVIERESRRERRQPVRLAAEERHVKSPEQLAIEDGDPNSSGSDTSSDEDSSSSSSHSRRRKSKTDKKHGSKKGSKKDKKKAKKSDKKRRSNKGKKKDKKAKKEKRDKEKEKERQQMERQATKAANAFLLKAAPHLMSLRSTMSTDNFQYVAPMIKDPILEAEKVFAHYEGVAKEIVAECFDNAEGFIEFAADLNNKISMGRKQIGLAASMMLTVAKAASSATASGR